MLTTGTPITRTRIGNSTRPWRRRCDLAPRDLKNNRAGRISTKQMLVLVYKGVAPLVGLMIPLLGVMLMAGTVMLAEPWLSTIYWFLGALVFGALAVLANGVILKRRLLLLAVDLMLGRTAQVEGRVTASRAEEMEDGINQIMRKQTLTYYFVQGGRSLQVPEGAYEELYSVGGVGHFRLHFTPYSQFLLSMEAPRRTVADDEARNL
jgi:hypothetical protein